MTELIPRRQRRAYGNAQCRPENTSATTTVTRMQVLISDKDGRFPGEKGCQEPRIPACRFCAWVTAREPTSRREVLNAQHQMKGEHHAQFCVPCYEVWDKAQVVVDCCRQAAARLPRSLTETDETIEWIYDSTPMIDAVDVRVASNDDAA